MDRRRSVAAGIAAIFDPARLRLARQSRGLTKQELASQVGVTPAALSQYERSGSYSPSSETLARLALALGYPVEFFAAGRTAFEPAISEAHFRSLRSTTQVQRRQALTQAAYGAELAHVLERYVRLPVVDIPYIPVGSDATVTDVERVAADVRAELEVPPGPVPNVVRLLEAHGVVVSRLRSETDRVSAFSVRNPEHRPVVILTSNKDDAARSRMDAAHELGHLVMHDDSDVGSQVVERQANQFGAAFLMPADEIRQSLPRRLDFNRLIELKEVWGVSIAALIYRSRELGVIAESTYRRAMVRLSQHQWPDGTTWRTREPGDLGRPEEPTLLQRSLTIAVQQHAGDMSRLIPLPQEQFVALLGTDPAVGELGANERP